MKQFKFISMPVLIVAVALIFVAAPVFADHGSDSGSRSSGDGNTSRSSQTETGDDSGGVTSGSGEVQHHHGGRIVAAMQRHHKTAAEREHACESHKQGLETKFSHIVANSQSMDDRITDVLNKTIAYQQANNVSVDNFDNLVATAQSAKSSADTAIANLKTVTPSLDCNDVSVANDVAVFKDSAKQTRDSLKAYRSAVKAVIKALLGAKQSSTSEGSDQ